MTAAPAAAVNPLTMVIATRRLDDDSQVYARVVLMPAFGRARVLNTVFEATTHAKVVLRAVASVVRYSGLNQSPLRVVVPDRVIVALLNGTPAGQIQLQPGLHQNAIQDERTFEGWRHEP
ncbi:MAG: hypothetical protein IT374_22750 [Polyangiaceae bacterium]|nr:hypothetical protein [Polyangiaceae bacterium]